MLLLPTMLLVCIIVFSLLRFIPGSAVDMIVYNYQKSGVPVTYEEVAAKLGLDKPAPEQFVEWVGNLVQGDLGTSLFRNESVWSIISRQVPVSLELGLLTLVLTILISVPLGLYCASHPDSPADNIIRFLAVVLMSIPIFWLGTLVLVYPAIWWKYSVPLEFVGFFENPAANMKMFLVPAIVGAVTQSGMMIRAVRTMTLETLRQDYVRTAWAKGARERRVMYQHAFRNSLIPIITLFGGAVAGLIGGSVVLENMFNIPGIGQQLVSALNNRDYILAQGCTVVFAIFVMLVNLLVDLAYTWCDPRVSLE